MVHQKELMIFIHTTSRQKLSRYEAHFIDYLVIMYLGILHTGGNPRPYHRMDARI